MLVFPEDAGDVSERILFHVFSTQPILHLTYTFRRWFMVYTIHGQQSSKAGKALDATRDLCNYPAWVQIS